MTQIKERDIVTNIILSIVTCGIYGIFWFICITDDAGRVAKDPNFSGGKAVVLTIITCGIYGWFWAYKLGQNITKAKRELNLGDEDLSTLYLILMILMYAGGVTGIILYCLAQNELNNISKALQNKGNNEASAQ